MQRLTAQRLTKSYQGRTVVNHVNLEVNMGEVVGLLGPNGAGKTTTFYMVVGLTRPDSGAVLIDGTDITKMPMYLRARQGIGYLAQEPSIFRKLTVKQNILAILEMMPLTRAEQEHKAMSLLEDLKIDHLVNSMAISLSGGERRRLEISRSLAVSPNFLLLDEPFAGVDPIAVGDIQSIVTHLKDKGIGVLITDHNVHETLGIVDRAYIINEGTIIESGSPDKIVQSEQVKKHYLGENFALR